MINTYIGIKAWNDQAIQIMPNIVSTMTGIHTVNVRLAHRRDTMDLPHPRVCAVLCHREDVIPITDENTFNIYETL